MKQILIFLLFISLLMAQNYPKLYNQLSTPLFQELHHFHALDKLPIFSDLKQDIHEYEKRLAQALTHGHELDIKPDKNKTRAYLKELRSLQKLHDKIQKNYKRRLYKSINENQEEDFYSITSVMLPIVYSDRRLKQSVASYYAKTKTKKNSSLNALFKDNKLDMKSYTDASEMFQTTIKDDEVIELTALKDFKENDTNKVQLISILTKTGYEIYLENHAYFDASVKLEAHKIENLQSSQPLPYTTSIASKSRVKVLELTVLNPRKKASYSLSYLTQIGRFNPDYDKSHLYALPFTREKSFELTQGFNGQHTHKGTSAYALDFAMPIGTKVHAMREGVVVALESKNTAHGFSPEFRNKSNYVSIQHNDGTIAQYGHLNTDGVRVALGQRVYKHQYIAQSGNTGYSSGPHLHVHISAIIEANQASTSVPFTFLSKQGRINNPQEGSSYTAK